MDGGEVGEAGAAMARGLGWSGAELAAFEDYGGFDGDGDEDVVGF